MWDEGKVNEVREIPEIPELQLSPVHLKAGRKTLGTACRQVDVAQCLAQRPPCDPTLTLWGPGHTKGKVWGETLGRKLN